MTTAVKSPLTPDDLLHMPDAVNFELLDGKLVERHLGSESSAIAAAILVILGQFVRARRVGHLFGADADHMLFPDRPREIRRPDVSFVRSGRFPNDRPPSGYTDVAPDQAVEVLSPGDLAYEVDQKIQECLSVGVPLIWVVNPQTRTVRIHRLPDDPLGPISFLNESDTISGERVLEGLECPVAEFFRI